MASPETQQKKELDHILVYRHDKREADRLFGDSSSYARRFNAILDVLKRERLIEKVRRRILGTDSAYNSSEATPEDATAEPPDLG